MYVYVADWEQHSRRTLVGLMICDAVEVVAMELVVRECCRNGMLSLWMLLHWILWC